MERGATCALPWCGVSVFSEAPGRQGARRRHVRLCSALFGVMCPCCGVRLVRLCGRARRRRLLSVARCDVSCLSNVPSCAVVCVFASLSGGHGRLRRRRCGGARKRACYGTCADPALLCAICPRSKRGLGISALFEVLWVEKSLVPNVVGIAPKLVFCAALRPWKVLGRVWAVVNASAVPTSV